MNKQVICALAVLLAGCGGESANNASLAPTVVVVAHDLGTGNPYYQMMTGTQITYAVQSLVGTWDETSQKITVVSYSPVEVKGMAPGFGATQTLQYSTNYCGKQQFFVTTYRIGVDPLPAPIDFGASLQDSLFTSSGGTAYIGEGMNQATQAIVAPGEAKITMLPVAGESITETSVVYETCGSSRVTIPAYKWRYTTVEHLDTWRGYSDVWRTSLEEFNGSGFKPQVYNYFFAKNRGMVAFQFGTLQADNTVTAGYEYYSAPK